jgi:hypothetical protein
LKEAGPVSWSRWALTGVVAWGGALVALTHWPSRSVAQVPVNRPVEVPAPGFATSQECRSCHPGNYASWHASFHRTMTQVARPGNILAPMAGREWTSEGATYRVERRGEAYFVSKRPALAPLSAAGAPRELVLLTGSHNMQFLWMATGDGRTLEHFPFGWLTAEKAWVPLTDTFLCPPEFHPLHAVGDWNRGCIDCHTTQGRSRPVGAASFNSEVTEFGISCEACHGEGRDHVQQNHNPVRRYVSHLTGRPDPTIANPARMKGPQAALVCGQCHSVWAFSSLTAQLDWVRRGAEFRPGQSDLPERFVVQPASSDHAGMKKRILEANPTFYEDSFWADGQVRVVGREFNGVQASPCFKGGEFSCLTCHELHPAKTDRATLQAASVNQIKPGAESDSGCLQCHPAIGVNVSAHTHHAATSVGSRCYDCHLPHSSFGLLRAVRSHQVSSPTVDESLRFGRPNACNLCHLDRPIGWTADHLTAWYGHPKPDLSDDDRKIAAGALWLIKGDAGQRALVAWSMGWAPAQQAAGRDWLPPYLLSTLVDPYAAVRFVAWRSLQTLPGYERFAFAYTASRPEIKAVAAAGFVRWTEFRRRPTSSFDPALLLGADGRFEEFTYRRLLLERNNRLIFLVE